MQSSQMFICLLNLPKPISEVAKNRIRGVSPGETSVLSQITKIAAKTPSNLEGDTLFFLTSDEATVARHQCEQESTRQLPSKPHPRPVYSLLMVP